MGHRFWVPLHNVRTPGPGWGASSYGEPTLRLKASGPYRTTIIHANTARRFQRAHNVSRPMCSWVWTATTGTGTGHHWIIVES